MYGTAAAQAHLPQGRKGNTALWEERNACLFFRSLHHRNCFFCVSLHPLPELFRNSPDVRISSHK